MKTDKEKLEKLLSMLKNERSVCKRLLEINKKYSPQSNVYYQGYYNGIIQLVNYLTETLKTES